MLEKAHTWPFVLRVLTYFLKVGVLGEVSGEDLSRIFTSFPGGSFNTLMPHNACVRNHSLVSFTALLLSWIRLALIGLFGYSLP